MKNDKLKNQSMSSHRLLQVPLPAEEAPEGNEGQAGKGGGEGNPFRPSDR